MSFMSASRIAGLSLILLGLLACSDKPAPAPEPVVEPAPAVDENQVPQSVLNAIRANHPDLAATPHQVNVVPSPDESSTQLYEIVSPMGVLYTDASARWLMAGIMYYGKDKAPFGERGVVPYTRRPAVQMILASLGKTPDQEDIDAEEVKRLLTGDMTGRQMFDAMPLNMGFSHTIGAGTHKVVLFEDPDCPYCQKFHQDLAQAAKDGSLAGLDVEFVSFPYVLSDRHPNALARARAIACAPDPSEAWKRWMLATAQAPVENNRKNLDKLWEAWSPHNAPAGGNCARAALVDAWQQAGQQMGFVSTPTFLFSDGTTHEGLLSVSDLREMIRLAARNRAANPVAGANPLSSGLDISRQAAAALRDLTETVSEGQEAQPKQDQ